VSIAPIVQSITVKAPPARAFELFASHIGDWWKKGTTLSKTGHVAIVIEPRAGGRWFERDEAGAEIEWGKVLAWEPPARLLLCWQLNSRFEYDPAVLSEVEVTFAPDVGGGSIVTLEHRHLERLGVDAEKTASQLGSGWPTKLADFAAYADRQG
jgi:uncharacterized protein YndB with AHSA1/START domain